MSGLLSFDFGMDKQGGTALTRPMHYRKCSVWDFFMHIGTKVKVVIKPIYRFADGARRGVGEDESSLLDCACQYRENIPLHDAASILKCI